jgi:hypothetical protein
MLSATEYSALLSFDLQTRRYHIGFSHCSATSENCISELSLQLLLANLHVGFSLFLTSLTDLCRVKFDVSVADETEQQLIRFGNGCWHRNIPISTSVIHST